MERVWQKRGWKAGIDGLLLGYGLLVLGFIVIRFGVVVEGDWAIYMLGGSLL